MISEVVDIKSRLRGEDVIVRDREEKRKFIDTCVNFGIYIEVEL